MPVILEAINAADAADQADLRLILADTPDGDALLRQWQASGLHLWGGRFNGRLLALACCREVEDTWWLQHLQVRELTRRRGVATQLLTLLQCEAAARGRMLCVPADTRSDDLESLWRPLGFERVDDTVPCWRMSTT